MKHIDEHTRKRVRVTAVAVVAVIFVVITAFFWKVTQPRALSAADMAANGLVVFDRARSVGHFELTSHEGAPFTRQDLVGKWTMLFPGFTHCPDICPTTMAQLGQMWEYLDDTPKNDLQVLMLSVDPHRDSPGKLAQYVRYFNSEFLGLTGDLGTIANLAAQLNIAFDIVDPEGAPDTYEVAHSANIVLINPDGHYQGFFKPPFDPAILKLNYQSVWVQN